jgi:hypothetical protein
MFSCVSYPVKVRPPFDRLTHYVPPWPATCVPSCSKAKVGRSIRSAIKHHFHSIVCLIPTCISTHTLIQNQDQMRLQRTVRAVSSDLSEV